MNAKDRARALKSGFKTAAASFIKTADNQKNGFAALEKLMEKKIIPAWNRTIRRQLADAYPDFSFSCELEQRRIAKNDDIIKSYHFSFTPDHEGAKEMPLATVDFKTCGLSETGLRNPSIHICSSGGTVESIETVDGKLPSQRQIDRALNFFSHIAFANVAAQLKLNKQAEEAAKAVLPEAETYRRLTTYFDQAAATLRAQTEVWNKKNSDLFTLHVDEEPKYGMGRPIVQNLVINLSKGGCSSENLMALFVYGGQQPQLVAAVWGQPTVAEAPLQKGVISKDEMTRFMQATGRAVLDSFTKNGFRPVHRRSNRFQLIAG